MAAEEEILMDRNENRFGPAPSCLEVLRTAGAELLFNYSRAFQHGSDSELSTRLAWMHGIREERIIPGYGCEDILKSATHYFLKRGHTLLIPSASWWYYTALADEVGGVTVRFPLIEKRETYAFDVDGLIAMKAEHAPGLVLIASPNNPTGNVLSRRDLLRVLDAYRDTPVVLDQAYFGLTMDESDDFAPLTDVYPNLLILRTFSKLYALAGVRVGYGIIGEQLAGFRKYCSRNLGFNRIAEKLAIAALDDPAYYRDIVEKMAADRQAFYTLFRSFDGCRVFASEANFILVKLPKDVAPVLKAELDRQGLIIKFFQEPGFVGYARISLGTDRENARLREAICRAWPATGIRASAGGGAA